MYQTDYQRKLRKSYESLKQSGKLKPGDTCCKCKRHQSELSLTLELHHIIPIRECTEDLKDFPNTADNLATLCRECHHSYHACFESNHPDFQQWMSDVPVETVRSELAAYKKQKKADRQKEAAKHRAKNQRQS